jgi:hypothetical protein
MVLDSWAKRPWWEPISHLAGHIVIGSLLFCVLAAPAVGLSFLVTHLKSLGVSEFTLMIFVGLEHIILVADSVLLLVYIAVTGVKTAKEMLA